MARYGTTQHNIIRYDMTQHSTTQHNIIYCDMAETTRHNTTFIQEMQYMKNLNYKITITEVVSIRF